MKKLTLLIMALALAFCSSSLWAAGSCTQTVTSYPTVTLSNPSPSMKSITFVCTGDAVNGSIPDTDITAGNLESIIGMYLYGVFANPTTGGTAPDAADVFLLDKTTGEDYLGSSNAGTTPNKGANLIHATLPKSTMPYSYYMSNWFYFPIRRTLTLRVSNQATASANYTIELVFGR
jgi:hypothetical protein